MAVDIKLDNFWQITRAADGGVPLVTENECILQDICLEALSSEGELFYESEWGWSLMDFIQSDNNDLVLIEITERIKAKLLRRTDIAPDTITVNVSSALNETQVSVSFSTTSSNEINKINISLDRVKAEVRII